MFKKYQPTYFTGVFAGLGLGFILGEYAHTGKVFGDAAPFELTVFAFLLIGVGSTLGQRWSRVAGK